MEKTLRQIKSLLLVVAIAAAGTTAVNAASVSGPAPNFTLKSPQARKRTIEDNALLRTENDVGRHFRNHRFTCDLVEDHVVGMLIGNRRRVTAP